jgi:hypothetical protein
MLSEQRRQQLDGIVHQMIQSKESDSNIQFVVDDFKHKYDAEQPLDLKKLSQAPQKSAIEKVSEVVPNLALGAAKGVVSTVKGAANLGEKYLLNPIEKITGNGFSQVANLKPGETATDQFITPNLTEPTNTTQSIGKGLEQIAEFLVPSGAVGKIGKAAEGASKLEKIGALAGRASAEAISAGGVTALQTGGNAQETRKAALLGGAFPFAGLALKGIGKIGSAVVEHLASTLSGVPKAAIKHAIENPEAVQKAISVAAQDGEGAAQKIYNNAIEAVDSLKEARRIGYQQGLAQLEKDATYTKKGQLYIKRVLTPSEAATTKGYIPGTKIGVPTNLSTKGIKDVFTRTAKEFGAEGGGKGGLDFTNVALDDSHVNKLQKLQERIYNWGDTTPTGVDKLRQVIDSYKVGGINLGSSESKFNKIIGDLRTNLNSYLGERVPQIAEMRKEYAIASEVIDNIRNQLKIGSNDPNTALRKLVNVFNPKSSLYRPVVEQLGEKAGKDLMSDIAGLVMSKWTPEGLGKYVTSALGGAEMTAAIAHPISALTVLPTAAMSSPRIVGQAATMAGKIGKNKTAQTVSKAAIQGVKNLLIKEGRKL